MQGRNDGREVIIKHKIYGKWEGMYRCIRLVPIKKWRKQKRTNYILIKHINTRIFTRKEMSKVNDVFQVDYLPDEKKIKINLPEEVWKNIDTVTLTRLFREELVVEKQKESEAEYNI